MHARIHKLALAVSIYTHIHLLYVGIRTSKHPNTQWCSSALIIGGRRHSGKVPTIFGGIQATIPHPSKFGGTIPLPVPPGIAPMPTHIYMCLQTYRIYTCIYPNVSTQANTHEHI